MPRFSLRDLFWLILVVGMGFAWWKDRSALKRQLWYEFDSAVKQASEWSEQNRLRKQRQAVAPASPVVTQPSVGE